MIELRDRWLHLKYATKLVKDYQDTSDKIGHAKKLMEDHAELLIYEARKFQEIEKAWLEIEDNGTVNEARDFYNIVHDILSSDQHE